jgi:hypothetical protein
MAGQKAWAFFAYTRRAVAGARGGRADAGLLRQTPERTQTSANRSVACNAITKTGPPDLDGNGRVSRHPGPEGLFAPGRTLTASVQDGDAESDDRAPPTRGPVCPHNRSQRHPAARLVASWLSSASRLAGSGTSPIDRSRPPLHESRCGFGAGLDACLSSWLLHKGCRPAGLRRSRHAPELHSV